MVFILFLIESLIESQTSYLVYFAICYFLAILGQIIFLKFFEIKSKEEVEEMREAYMALYTT